MGKMGVCVICNNPVKDVTEIEVKENKNNSSKTEGTGFKRKKQF